MGRYECYSTDISGAQICIGWWCVLMLTVNGLIEVTAPRFARAERPVTVAAGQTSAISIRLEPDAAAPDDLR